MFLNKTIFKKWIKEAYSHNCLGVDFEEVEK